MTVWDDPARMIAQGEFLRAQGFRQKKPARILNRLLEVSFFDLISLIKPSTILEIGAHAAEFSQKARQKFPATKHVIAIEANPDVFDKNKDRLQGIGVRYLNCAISDKSGITTLKVPKIRGVFIPTMGSVRSAYVDAQSMTSQEYEVEAREIDSFDIENAAIWLDVEGGIREVISGGKETFSTCVALYAELDDQPQWSGGMTASDAINELSQLGLVPILRDYEHPFAYNCIFVRRDILLGKSESPGSAAISRWQNDYWRRVRRLGFLMPWMDVRLAFDKVYRRVIRRESK